MRSILLLAFAATAQATTYTNTFGSSDPAPQFQVNPLMGQGYAYDPSVAYSGNPTAIMKPWTITPTDGSFGISGWVSLPQNYVDANPGTAGFGACSFKAILPFADLAPFKISDLTSVSYQLTVNGGHTAPTHLGVWLLAQDGKNYQLSAMNSTEEQTTAANGDLVYTYSNITLSDDYQNPDHTPFSADAEYVGLLVNSYANYSFPSYQIVRGQYLDITLQSASIVTTGGAIPEPSTYGLMLGGLALAGAAIRRRRRAK